MSCLIAPLACTDGSRLRFIRSASATAIVSRALNPQDGSDSSSLTGVVVQGEVRCLLTCDHRQRQERGEALAEHTPDNSVFDDYSADMCKKRQELFGIGGSSLTSKTVVPQGLPRVCVDRSRGLSEPIHVEVLDAANAERVEPQSCRCAGHRARPKPKPHHRVRRRKGRIDVR